MKLGHRSMHLGPFEIPRSAWGRVEHIAHDLIVRGGRKVRYLGGRLEGLGYELAGRRPDPTVTDDVLSDRIRSEIGPLEKRLDVPRVHVMVNDHVVTLHGTVGTLHEAVEVERAVAAVSGVAGVNSYLHIGFGRGTARPSEGWKHQAPSAAFTTLCGSVQDAGAPSGAATRTVRAVMATLGERLPAQEWDQVICHLPEDVRRVAVPPRRAPKRRAAVRTAESFGRAVATAAGCTPERAIAYTTAVMHAVKDLVPEETADVAASLPHELRVLWESA